MRNPVYGPNAIQWNHYRANDDMTDMTVSNLITLYVKSGKKQKMQETHLNESIFVAQRSCSVIQSLTNPLRSPPDGTSWVSTNLLTWLSLSDQTRFLNRQIRLFGQS